MIKAWRDWRKRAKCFHHDHKTGKSYMRERLEDMGRRKLFWCEDCYKTWIF